jgi:hypothetical protein
VKKVLVMELDYFSGNHLCYHLFEVPDVTEDHFYTSTMKLETFRMKNANKNWNNDEARRKGKKVKNFKLYSVQTRQEYNYWMEDILGESEVAKKYGNIYKDVPFMNHQSLQAFFNHVGYKTPYEKKKLRLKKKV